MKILKNHARSVDSAVDVLQKGQLVGVPTETVYGLAGDATNGQSVAAIYASKTRPQFNPLIAHVCNVAMVEQYCDIDALSRRLMIAFWPGPLTLVLPLKQQPFGHKPIHALATAGLSTLAVRHPQGVFSDIIHAFGRPLVAPSANKSGRLSPTTAQAVAAELGDQLSLIIDGGACAVGVESTIIKVTAERIELLRPGGLATHDIEKELSQTVYRADQRAAIEAPGMLHSHYAPNARVRLNARQLEKDESLLAFGSQTTIGQEGAVKMLNLSPLGNVQEAAVHLFDYLKKLDQKSVQCIAVQPVPMTGLGEAINDRLLRAAAPRGEG